MCDAVIVIFNKWFDEHLRRESLEEPYMQQVLVKYRSLIPALSLIFHLVDIATRYSEGGPVSKSALVKAINYAEYLETHARRIYSLKDYAQNLPSVTLSEHIRCGRLEDNFSLRDIQRKRWRNLDTREKIVDALERLETFNWIKPHNNDSNNKAFKYWINPSVVEG